MGFTDYQKALAPGFLKGPFGAAWQAAHGAASDLELERAKESAKARYPDTAPLDALGSLAADRGILQGPNETTAHYLARLKQIWGAWSVAGSAWGLLAQLAGMGYKTASVVYANGYVMGPSLGVLAPDPLSGGAGTPPAVQRPQAAYATGGASGVWAAGTNYGLGAVIGHSGGTWIAIQAGTSAAPPSTGPAFTPGDNYTDGTVKWQWQGYFANATKDLPPLVVQQPSVLGSGNSQGVYATLAYSPTLGGVMGPQLVSFGSPSYGPNAPTVLYPAGFAVPGEAWSPLNWNRFVLVLDAETWTGTIANPPVGVFAAELDLIRSVVARWRAGHCACVGIMIRLSTTDPRSAWGWPLAASGLTTNDGETLPPCWLSRMGSGYGGLAFPTTIPRWMPGMPVSVSQRFVMPSGGGVGNAASTAPRAWYSAGGPGTTGLIEPVWPGSGTVADNGIVWTYGGPLGEWGQPGGVPTIVTFDASGATS